MSKKRLSSAQCKSRRTSRKSLKKAEGKRFRFAGVSLGGGKTNRTSIAIVEYYPLHNKTFLTHLYEKIQTKDEVSADLQVFEILSSIEQDLDMVAFDVPLSFPKCLRCKLKCPGYEKCKETEIVWMWNWVRKNHRNKKPKKLFTPYTQRCVEMYLQTELEEPFFATDAMGANLAPLTARAHYLQRRLKIPVIEVMAKLSLWRIGSWLKMMKSHLRFHKHQIGGDLSRQVFLDALSSHNVAFVYHQDVKTMVENVAAFDAFLCAFTASLKFRGQVEKKPANFPRGESWIEIPKIEKP